MSIFTDAKNKITASPSSYFPGGETKNGEYWFRRRPGDKTPSAHIVPGSDAVKDFGDPDYRGSVLDCYAELNGLTPKEAAEKITGRAADSRSSDSRPAESARKKPSPVIPIPESAREALNAKIAASVHGQAVAGWRYHTSSGGWAFSVARFEDASGGKSIIPFYWTGSGWTEGVPYKSDRPLFNLPGLLQNPDLPVLVVEGEKCASVKVPGWVVVTWSSGASSVNKTDWKPLAERDVTIWPDADEPGVKAARNILNHLPGAKILDITGRAKGWDIADAVEEGIDPAEFIASCTALHAASANKYPFIPLGYDSGKYWFLNAQRLPYAIPKGQFTQSRILELAPPSFWNVHGMLTDQASIRVPQAQEFLINESGAVGMFDLDKIRGSGVWLDRGRVVVNDGSRIVSASGEKIDLADFEGDAHYVRSEVRFGELVGDEASEDDGRALVELFVAQGFSRPYQGMAALGWSLIAPFGGLLRWRPHLWISGRKGSGKSFVLDSIIAELCGPFAHQGSGKDTEAGIRRTLNMDARPVILDEMEPRTKNARENVSRIIDLARNASGDGSGYITMASGDSGTARFIIRSCFCFASINVPEEGAAFGSRIIQTELKVPLDDRGKIKASRELYSRAMRDPASYRRRIFRALPRILKDIEFLRENLPSIIGDQRKADVYAPVMAAAWAVQARESIDTAQGKSWLYSALEDVMQSEETVEDEDRVIEHILGYKVRTDDNKTRTVAELILAAESSDPGFDWAREQLSRNGIKFHEYKNGDGQFHKALAIATKSDEIEKVLEGTPYEHGYDSQLRRSVICVNQDSHGEQISMKIGRKRCRLLDWTKFRARYLDGDGSGRMGELF